MIMKVSELIENLNLTLVTEGDYEDREIKDFPDLEWSDIKGEFE